MWKIKFPIDTNVSSTVIMDIRNATYTTIRKSGILRNFFGIFPKSLTTRQDCA